MVVNVVQGNEGVHLGHAILMGKCYILTNCSLGMIMGSYMVSDA